MIDIVRNCDCYLILMSGCIDCTWLFKIKSTNVLNADVVIIV